MSTGKIVGDGLQRRNPKRVDASGKARVNMKIPEDLYRWVMGYIHRLKREGKKITLTEILVVHLNRLRRRERGEPDGEAEQF